LKLSATKIDPAIIEEGRWVGDIPDMGNLELKVRGIGNSDFRRRQSQLVRALPRGAVVGGKIEPADQDKITGTLLLETCLIDWKNLTDDDGKDIPFSREQAADLLLKPEYARFRDAVAYAAGVVGDLTAAETADAAKN
jgi:hypothetical protein